MASPEANEKGSKKKTVQDKLLELVRGGSYRSGDKLPSERELAEGWASAATSSGRP